jgi:hypothetical protein
MKPIKLFLIMMFILPLVPAGIPSAIAAGSARLNLHSESSTIKLGDETIVEIRVKDMASVYGAEFALSFDPEVLEVVDSDVQASGVQIASGEFFDLSKNHFPLQNHADNSEGSVRYAVSMLNPAPSAQGDGAMAKIAFRAKSLGQAGVRIETSTFGTRDGEAVTPDFQNEFSIQVAEQKLLLAPSSLLMFLAAIILLTIFVVLFRKKSLSQKEMVLAVSDGQ